MWLLKLRRLARKAGREALILFFAVRHPDTPLPVKLAATAALAYVLSPIDLIPDLPLVGAVDDLLLLSLGLPMLVRRLPPRVLAETGVRADRVLADLGFGRTAAAEEGGDAGGARAGARAPVEAELVEPVRPRRRAAASPAQPRTPRSRAGRVSEAKIVSETPKAARGRRPRTAGG